MENYKPKEFILGECFICNKPTEDPQAYGHIECCTAMWAETEKRRAEARNLEKSWRKQQK